MLDPLALVWYCNGVGVRTSLVSLTREPKVGDYLSVPAGENGVRVPILQVTPLPDDSTLDFFLQVGPPRVLESTDNQNGTAVRGRVR